jgi:hypothetical protein
MAISDYINKRREDEKKTPWADWVDTRRESGKGTGYADWLNYDSPEGTVDPVLSPQQACEGREGYHWEPMLGGGTCVPNAPYTPEPGPVDPTGDLPVAPPDPINPKDITTPQDNTPIPYTQLGAYSDAFQQMLNSPAFGGQTLEELENARIQALQGDLSNQFGYSADELQNRLNAEAEASGMFTSGARVGAIGRGLSELGRQQGVEFAKGAADIRGQRPELLLQEREQRANIANMWGTMDLESQRANLDAMLNNKLMEYDRQFKNGELTIDAFNGNVNQMGLFLDYMVSNAKNNNDLALITANIDQIYNGLDDADKNRFAEWIKAMMSAYGGTIGGG